MDEVRTFLGVSSAPSAPVDPLPESLERSLGKAYCIERERGGGGMARVFVARDRQLDRDIAVKVLKADVAEGLSAERFAREMRLAASLQHPNIVPVLSAGATRRGVPYYTMPYIRGESLRDRLATPLSLAEAVDIARDIAAALAYAHAAGIVHRDIKPENVLLSGRVAMVADFGIAKAIVDAAGADDGAGSPSSTLTVAGTSLGTPAYMAPEQVAGESVGAPADVYAWGLVAYEALAGKHAFAAKTTAQQLMVAQIMEAPAPVHAVAPNVPANVADLVMRCLEKDPARRPRAGEDIYRVLAVTANTGRN